MASCGWAGSAERGLRAAGTLLAAALMLGACGERASAPPPSPTPAPRPVPAAIEICAGADPRWRTLEGAGVDAAVLGSGPAVVFVNDSGNNPCGWLGFAQRLAASGRRVAVFAYTDPSAIADAQSLRETLAVAAAAAGTSGRYVLVGASLGGRLVIEAAARHPAGLQAIVSLSGERTIEDYGDILPDARRVRSPTLYIGAREDGYTDGARQPLELHRAMRGRPNELLQVAGGAHGVDLLDPEQGGPRPLARLTRFLAEHAG